VATNSRSISTGPPATPDEHLHRPPGRHGLGEADVLRVVQVQQRHPVEPEPLQALLDRAPHPVTGELPGVEVPVQLRGQHVVRGQPADAAQGLPDPTLGLTAAVGVRRVERVHRPGQRGDGGGDPALGRDLVAGVPGHRSERTAPDRQGCDPQPGGPERAPGQVLRHVLCR
jgi:hypothetical protein